MNEQMDSLQSFLYSPQQHGYIDNRNLSFHIAQYYLFAIVLAELSWLTLTIVLSLHADAFILAILILSWVLLWAIFGKTKGYLSTRAFLFWVETCFHGLMLILTLMLQKHQFILCGSSTAIIIFTILQLCISQNPLTNKIFLYLYIWYSCIFYSRLKHLYKAPFKWSTMLLPNILCFYFCVVYGLLWCKTRQFSILAKWRLVSLLYPLALLFVICFVGSCPGFNWGWLTVINHFVFVLCFIFAIKHHKTLLSPPRHPQALLQKPNPPLLHQISSSYFQQSSDYIASRFPPTCHQQVGICCICLSQPASILYTRCLHLTLCEICVVHVLALKQNKCQICRQVSLYLLEVERMRNRVFQGRRKFRFK